MNIMKRRNRENGYNVEEWKGRNKCGQLQVKKERHYQKYILHYISRFLRIAARSMYVISDSLLF